MRKQKNRYRVSGEVSFRRYLLDDLQTVLIPPTNVLAYTLEGAKVEALIIHLRKVPSIELSWDYVSVEYLARQIQPEQLGMFEGVT